MQFDLSDDQNLLLSAFESMLAPYRDPPQTAHGYVAYSGELQARLSESGFLEVAAQDGFGLLEAALLVEAGARCPVSVEIAASVLIGPLLDFPFAPLALAMGLGRPVRYLDHAASVCIFAAGECWLGTLDPSILATAEGVAAYPLATLTRLPDDVSAVSPDLAAAILRRARIGIAAEAAGLMRGALDLTVRYVQDRQQFGRPLGDFQAIQHRLAEDAQLVQSCRSLAFRAAYEDSEQAASLACLYAQDAIRKIIYDCHQFSGAMGLTLEYPLHLWTYRLKWLQGELGGRSAQAASLAELAWPVD